MSLDCLNLLRASIVKLFPKTLCINGGYFDGA